MSVVIEQKQEDLIEVNGKTIYKDSNNLWICSDDLTAKERAHFVSFLNAKK